MGGQQEGGQGYTARGMKWERAGRQSYEAWMYNDNLGSLQGSAEIWSAALRGMVEQANPGAHNVECSSDNEHVMRFSKNEAMEDKVSLQACNDEVTRCKGN